MGFNSGFKGLRKSSTLALHDRREMSTSTSGQFKRWKNSAPGWAPRYGRFVKGKVPPITGHEGLTGE